MHTRHYPSPAPAGPTQLPLDLEEIRLLAGRPPAPTASIFLPVHRAHVDLRENQLRLRNLVHEARRQLAVAIGEQGAAAVLAPVAAAHELPEFWRHPSEGLALFCAEGDARHLWLPGAVPEQAIVCASSHVKPLMPFLQGDGVFYLLEISQHGVHLHLGSRFGLRPLALPGAPASIDEAIPGHEPEHHTEVRTMHRSGQGAAIYFGTAGDERGKDRIVRFFRRVDECICSLLHGQREPLVIAGIGFLLPLYAAANRYPHLEATGVEGNPDELTPSVLHERAWRVVGPRFAAGEDAARERYAQLSGTDRTSQDLPTILRALRLGRVDDLFVSSDTERWGVFAPEHDRIDEHRPRWIGDGDLLNTALIHAFATRARPHVVPRVRVPGGGDAAAIFRY